MSQRYQTFYMHSGEREILIEEHDFYVREAKRRLLSQFSDIEGETEALQESYLATLGENFDPDRHDESDLYDAVDDKTATHYLALDSMKNNVTLVVTAGMYHLFDKAIRERTIRELGRWLDPKAISSMVWDLNQPKLMELLEWIGITDRGKEFARKLDLCRQVVNVYKHGDGLSHRKLRDSNPEYYYKSSYSDSEWFKLDHSELELDESQFDEFAAAIKEFWEYIPQNCLSDDAGPEPTWFLKSYTQYLNRT